MSKKNEEEQVKEHMDVAAEIAKSLYDSLEKRAEEHPASKGDILVGVGMFASMIISSIFEQSEGMTAQLAIKETHRWASIVVSEVSDYFTKSE